jgi:hypothetical protein
VTLPVKKARSRVPPPAVRAVKPVPLPSLANPHILALLPDKAAFDYAVTHSSPVPDPSLATLLQPLVVPTTADWVELPNLALLFAQHPALLPAPATVPPLPEAPSIAEPAPLLRELHWADHLVLGLLSSEQRARADAGLVALAAASPDTRARLRARGGSPLFPALVLERMRAAPGKMAPALAFWAATRTSGEVRTSLLEHWTGLALSHEEHVVAADLFCLDVLTPAEMRTAILGQRTELVKMTGDVPAEAPVQDMCVSREVL